MSYIFEKNIHWQEVDVNGKMVSIPVGWMSKLCGDVLNSVSIPKTSQIHTNDTLPTGRFMTISQEQKYTSGFSDKNPVLASFTEPHIVFGDHSCTLKLVTQPYVVAGDGVKVFSGGNNNTYFVMFTLKNLHLQTLGYQRHCALLKEQRVNVPPLPEQTAIANILSDQEDLVAHYNDLIALHEKRFAYLSDELLSGRLHLHMERGEIVCSNNEEWQNVELNGDSVMIPTNWSMATLPELCTLTNGSSFKPSEKEEQGIPIVRIQNLTDPTSEYHYYSGSKKGLVSLVAGDLLFPWSGTIGVYTYTLASGYLNQHIFKVTPVEIDGSYAKYFLRFNIDKFQRSGLTMPHITLAEIRKRKLVVCLEKEQQKLIGQVLSEQEALIAEYKKLRDAEKKRFDWLSDALLSGTYRVKLEA